MKKLKAINKLNSFWVRERQDIGGIKYFNYVHPGAGITLYLADEHTVGLVILSSKETFEIPLIWDNICEYYHLGEWDEESFDELLEGESL
jgi:hypothetical protein